MKMNKLFIAGALCTILLTSCEKYTSDTVSYETTSMSYAAVSSEVLPISSAAEKSVLTESKFDDTNENNTLFGDILPQTDMLRFFTQDYLYGDIFIRFAETDQSSVMQDIIDSVSEVPAEKADDWSASMMTLPVYGFYAYDEDGVIKFAASWSNGYWIDSSGTAYRLDYDFSNLELGYNWESYGYYGDGYVSSMPCGYYFCIDENGWIKDNIPERLPFYPVRAPEDVTVEYIGFDNVGGLSLLITNNREKDFFILDFFHIEVLLDDKWYDIPIVPNYTGKPAFSETRSKIPAGTSCTATYPLELYGDLPSGNYRIIGDEFYVEFVI